MNTALFELRAHQARSGCPATKSDNGRAAKVQDVRYERIARANAMLEAEDTARLASNPRRRPGFWEPL